MDRLTPEKRSWNMSRIRSGDTGPEKKVRSVLHRMGYRFRLHSRHLPGKPDIVLPRFKTVVFVHGCFWHRHEKCPKATTPKTNKSFWLNKFRRNVERDREIETELISRGWRVLIIWECETQDEDALKNLLMNKLPHGDHLLGDNAVR
ncbi:very short patch repair endonuclease [Desulfovulcanus sp.]